MAKFDNIIAVPSGLKVLSQSPIDDRLIFGSRQEFETMMATIPSGELPPLYEGMEVKFLHDIETGTVPKSTNWEWRESSFGMLSPGYTYTGEFDIIAGVDYRNRTFNLVLVDRVSEVNIVLSVDTAVISVPFKDVPFSALEKDVFEVKIYEDGVDGVDIPNYVTTGTGGILIDVYPTYVTGTILTIKIS